jgi:hypothetical protein
MKVSFLKKWDSKLNPHQKDLLLGLVIVMGIAIIYYFQWSVFLTNVPDSKVNIDQPGRYFWWANDSRSYRDAGEWIFGRSDSHAISIRPWLYPLLLGSARTLFSTHAEEVLWITQILMWLASGSFIYLGLHNSTRSTVLAILGAGFFYSHPSPLILTFHGMTETLNILLISMFVWMITTSIQKRLYYAILLIVLATVTKPIYLVFLGLLILYVVIQDRPTTRLKQAGWIALILLPIWIQLVLSYAVSGRLTVSAIGGYTFKNYLVADVYMQAEGVEWRPTMALIEDWDLHEQLDYLWQHKRGTVITFRNHLVDSNLWTGSYFTLGEDNRMDGFAIAMNSFTTYLHLFMLPFVAYYLLSPRYSPNKQTITLLYLCFVIQWLTSGISTGQEDRLLMTAIPLWIVVYLLVIRGIFTPQSIQESLAASGSTSP